MTTTTTTTTTTETSFELDRMDYLHLSNLVDKFSVEQHMGLFKPGDFADDLDRADYQRKAEKRFLELSRKLMQLYFSSPRP
jgi:hypothetical protein